MHEPKSNKGHAPQQPNNHIIRKPLIQKKEINNTGLKFQARPNAFGQMAVFGKKGSYQTKLKTGTPGDKFEKEADAVADQVVEKSSASDVQSSTVSQGIGETQVTPPIQTMKVGSSDLQKVAEPEEEKVQMQEEEEAQLQIEDESEVQMMEDEEAQLQTKEDSEAQLQTEEDSEVQMMEDEEAQLQTEEESVQMAEADSAEDNELQLKPEKPEVAPEPVEMVQKQPEPEPPKPVPSPPPVQLKETDASSEEDVQLKEEEESTEEPEKVQLKSKMMGSGDDTNIASQIASSRGSGSPMEDSVKSEMESGFGHDFSNVKIHTGSQAANLNKGLGAKAFTSGNDIYFNDGEYRPDTKDGKHLLAHELTHTVQQGATASGIQMKRDTDVEISLDPENQKSLIIKVKSLEQLFSNKKINDFITNQFNRYYSSSAGGYYKATVHLGTETHNAFLKYNSKDKFYNVISISGVSKDYKDRDISSSNEVDWLTEFGKLKYSALKAHFDDNGAIDFGELYAPQGMIILMELNKLFYLIDDKTYWRMAYSDFEQAKAEDKHSPRQIRLKQYYVKSRKKAPDKKVRIYLLPDRRPMYQKNYSENELESYKERGVEPVQISVRRRSPHPELRTVYVFEMEELSLRKLKDDQSGERKLEGYDMVLLLKLFNQHEQQKLKKAQYLQDYCIKKLDRDEMANVMTTFDPNIFSLTTKLKLIDAADRRRFIHIDVVRPILQQYPDHKWMSVKYSRNNNSSEKILLKTLIAESTKKKKYKEPKYKVGKYDDVTDENFGILGLDQESIQNRLLRLQDLHDLKKLRSGDDKNATESQMKHVFSKYGIVGKDQANKRYEDDKKWFVKYFRDNALKMAQLILNASEQAIAMEMKGYYTTKYYDLERDFAVYQPALEKISKATSNLYGGTSIERASAIRTLEGQQSELRGLLEAHPYLMDINKGGHDYNRTTQLADIYNYYREHPKQFRDFFLNKLHESLGERLSYIQDTRENLRDDPEFIWELEQVIQLTRNYLGIDSNGPFYKAIKGKLKEISDAKFWQSIGIAVAAVALGIVTAGIGTVVTGVAGTVIGATAAVGGISLSVYDVYITYQDYSRKHAAANINSNYGPLSGLTKDDPSLIWLVVAIGGLALDLGAALKAFKLLGPAAKSLDEGATATKSFDDIVEELTETHKVLNKAQGEKLMQKAAAQREMADAWDEFLKSFSFKPTGELYSGLPFGAQSAYLAKFAIKSIKAGYKTFDEFLAQLIRRQKMSKLTKQLDSIDFTKLTKEEEFKLRKLFEDLVLKADEFASNLPTISKETRQWKNAIEELKTLNKGKLDFKVNSATEAKELLFEARGQMNRYKQYPKDEFGKPLKYDKGYEVHSEGNFRELSVGNDLPHITWTDGKSRGHIYFNITE